MGGMKYKKGDKLLAKSFLGGVFPVEFVGLSKTFFRERYVVSWTVYNEDTETIHREYRLLRCSNIIYLVKD